MNRIAQGSNMLRLGIQDAGVMNKMQKTLGNTNAYILGMVGVNVGFYGLYKFSCGPKQARLRRTLTL